MIQPRPPRAEVGLPWDQTVADPVAALADARAVHGDTFAVSGDGHDYLFVFSAEGVRSFYELPEAAASKGVADWSMIRRKLPEELFADRRTFPHELFGRDDVRAYLGALDAALDAQVGELGPSGTFDAFAFSRRLGHRIGLASWAGGESARGQRFEQLVVALDVLDASEAFVRPDRMAAIEASGKADEYTAMAVAEALITETVQERAGRSGGTSVDLLDRIIDRWGGVAEPDRQIGIARDVILAHLASMSNLFAAIAWTIVNLVTRPDLLAKVREGDTDLAERCAMESIRLAQRSIMLRMVLVPVEVDDGVTVYTVGAGDFVATLLPLTNTTAGPGLGVFHADRWNKRRLREPSDLAARELVTTFGHGAHSCPAQAFSLAAIVRTVARLATEFDLTPDFHEVGHLPEQVGGVARADRPCSITYAQRVNVT